MVTDPVCASSLKQSVRGAWMCHRCGASGSWYDLKRLAGGGEPFDARQVMGNNSRTGARDARTQRRTPAALLRPIPDQRRVGSYPVNLFHNPRFSEVKDYLTGTGSGQRGIEERVLLKYGVGCATYRYGTQSMHRLPCLEPLLRGSRSDSLGKMRGV